MNLEVPQAQRDVLNVSGLTVGSSPAVSAVFKLTSVPATAFQAITYHITATEVVDGGACTVIVEESLDGVNFSLLQTLLSGVTVTTVGAVAGTDRIPFRFVRFTASLAVAGTWDVAVRTQGFSFK